MCGIVSILNVREQTEEMRQKALCMSQKIRHRGPDWSGIYCGGSAILAAERFPVNPPHNKEEYYYRSIFAGHFPSDSAALSVPSVPSVACSTAEALAWDKAFKNMNDPSGRAVSGIHEQAY